MSVTFEVQSTSMVSQGVTKLALDGQEIGRFVKTYTVRASAGEPTRLFVDLNAHDGFSLTLPTDVVLTATVLPGYLLREEITPAGKQWRVERDPAAW
jgi:hypothetical protein